MPFGLLARMGTWGPDPTWGGAIFGERGAQGHFAVTCAKIAKPIVMQFRLWAPSDSRNHEVDGGPDPPREGAIFGERVPHCKV